MGLLYLFLPHIFISFLTYNPLLLPSLADCNYIYFSRIFFTILPLLYFPCFLQFVLHFLFVISLDLLIPFLILFFLCAMVFISSLAAGGTVDRGMWRLLALLALPLAGGDVFTLGYLTGSQRRPGDHEYSRPGLSISGAISLAVQELNAGRLGERGHRLEFVVAETYGEELASIELTADLWTRNVTAYIGPQETCVTEARMAAAFNVPMISYVSVLYESH